MVYTLYVVTMKKEWEMLMFCTYSLYLYSHIIIYSVYLCADMGMADFAEVL